jgi:hypothetical protein
VNEQIKTQRLTGLNQAPEARPEVKAVPELLYPAHPCSIPATCHPEPEHTAPLPDPCSPCEGEGSAPLLSRMIFICFFNLDKRPVQIPADINFGYIYSGNALSHPEDERMLKPRRVPAIWCPAKKQMKN